MLPAPFEYFRPKSLDEAVKLLVEHGEQGKVLAGAHSLLPAMKLRLAQPKVIVDLGCIIDLGQIREAEGRLVIGAMTTHRQLETSTLVQEKCPLLAIVAAQIGDVQVRNRGTIGGNLVQADPSADWPAALLALEAEIHAVGPDGARVIRAKKFFLGLFQTALQPQEILSEIRIPFTGRTVAYVKTAQRASGFAIAGAAVVIDAANKKVRVGIAGVSAKPYRATGVENSLAGQALTPETLTEASRKAAQRIEALGDLHASADFRKHLAQVNTRRALEMAAARA